MEQGRTDKWRRKESCGDYQYWFQRFGYIELYEKIKITIMNIYYFSDNIDSKFYYLHNENI